MNAGTLTRRIRLRVDARMRVQNGEQRVIPAGGEYLRAVRTTADLLSRGRLPPEVALMLYAYELVERIREWLSGADGMKAGAFVIPLWPPALFDCGGFQGEVWENLIRLLPADLTLVCEIVERDSVQGAMREYLGLESLDTKRYQSAVEPLSGIAPERTTAAGLLVRQSRILLEWRPSSATVASDCWDIPGGHLEPGETPEQALIRELNEELGIRPRHINLAAILDEGRASNGLSYRHHIFIVNEWEGCVESRENQLLQWFDASQALEQKSLNRLSGVAIEHFWSKGLIADRGLRRGPPEEILRLSFPEQVK